MSFNTKQKAKRKEAFLNQTAQTLSPKAFFDKYYQTTGVINFGAYLLSGISIVLGVTAIFSLFQMFFGIDTTLLGIFEERPIFAYALLAFAAAFLFFIEYIKHKFNTEAMTEKYRETDDRGALETKIAFAAIVFSLFISGWGGILISDELAGTKKTETLTALNAEYLPSIASAKADKEAYFAAKSYRQKLSDKNVGEFNRLSQIVTDLEVRYSNSKTEAGVNDGFVAATTEGSLKMAAMLGGSQIAVELLLYFCLWWTVYFQARVYDEEGKQLSNSTSPPPLLKIQNHQAAGGLQNQIFNQAEKNPIGFFNRSSVDKTQNAHNTQSHTSTQAAETVVSQQAQPKPTHTNTHEVVDLEKQKKRVRLYIPRIHEDYTQKRFERISQDVETLAKYGFQVIIEKDKIRIKKSLPVNSAVVVNWGDSGLEINYKN